MIQNSICHLSAGMIGMWMKWPWWQTWRPCIGSAPGPVPFQKPSSYCLCQLPPTCQQQRPMLSPRYGIFPLRRLLVTWWRVDCLKFTIDWKDMQMGMNLPFLYVGPWLVPLSKGLWSIWSIVTGCCKTSYQPKVLLHSKKMVWERVCDHGSTGHSHESPPRSSSGIKELYMMPSPQQ